MRDLDKFRGCLLGGAVGDALGYAVEFSSEEDIFDRYGPDGIQHYDLQGGQARISDDTQMSLFTANALLYGQTRADLRGIGAGSRGYFPYAYRCWYGTQTERFPLSRDKYRSSWLVNFSELFSRRAPGNTCLSALAEGGRGTLKKPIHDSKGCGGVMRVGPIGVYYVDKPHYTIEDADRIGAEAAAVTHGHELGYLPAAGLVHIIYCLASGQMRSVSEAARDMLATLPRLFPDSRFMCDFVEIIGRAITLAESDIPDLEAIHELGEGWVAEETLAIALYCAIRHQDDFARAIVASVNHNGDSDSTGAVTGNILGALHGEQAIPAELLEHLELRDVILELADDLWHDCQLEEYGPSDPGWKKKYVLCRFGPEDLEKKRN